MYRDKATKIVADEHGSLEDYQAHYPEKRKRFRFWQKDKQQAGLKYTKMINKTVNKLAKEEGKRKKRDKPHIAKNTVLVTDETNARLMPCRVQDDHKLKFELRAGGKKEDKEVGILRSPHVLEIPSSIIPSWIARRILPKTIRFRMYTVQKEGEITHDPHIDELDEELKRRFEMVLMLEKQAVKTGFAKGLMAGLKDKLSLMDYIPYIIIALIVMFFLFAYQIAPYM